MYNSRQHTVAQIADMFRMCRQTIYRHLGAGPRFNVTPAAADGTWTGPPVPPSRAENLVHGSDQQSCPASRPAVMIAGHVPAVPFPPDQARGLMAAAVPARGGMEDRRDPDLAPQARRPATRAAAPPGAELGGPGLWVPEMASPAPDLGPSACFT
jgi:hypothetical protein